MCSKSSRSRSSTSMKKQKPKSTRNPPRKTTPVHNPSRKSRTKTRKHKFLSLKSELSKTESPNSSETCTTPTSTVEEENQNQLNLFPLYPENLFEEKETHDENVDYFFDSDGGATLNGFVWGETEGGVGLASDQEDSLTYAYQGQDSEEVGGGAESDLMRNALRQRDRDESEEKWVCYEEVVEKKETEESSSCCSTQQEHQSLMQGLCLKLDYQKIMNAWSDKGPLYIAGGDYSQSQSPSQIVPDVLDDPMAHDSIHVLGDGNVPVWKSLDDGTETVDGGEGGYRTTMMKMGEREARVLRYKEKRQSRLFSKRIRYEVRKLNAEKRPRMKGRFVKRS